MTRTSIFVSDELLELLHVLLCDPCSVPYFCHSPGWKQCTVPLNGDPTSRVDGQAVADFTTNRSVEVISDRFTLPRWRQLLHRYLRYSNFFCAMTNELTYILQIKATNVWSLLTYAAAPQSLMGSAL